MDAIPPPYKPLGQALVRAYFPIVGGNWSNGTNAGLWYVNCNNSASNSNTNIGARLASDTGRKPVAHGQPISAYPSGRLSWLLLEAEDKHPAAASSLSNVAAGPCSTNATYECFPVPQGCGL